MIPIAIHNYQDYLTLIGNKVCNTCKEEYPQETKFYAPFTLSQEMCEPCVEEVMQGLGEL